jgi:hypothetical protein
MHDPAPFVFIVMLELLNRWVFFRVTGLLGTVTKKTGMAPAQG